MGRAKMPTPNTGGIKVFFPRSKVIFLFRLILLVIGAVVEQGAGQQYSGSNWRIPAYRKNL